MSSAAQVHANQQNAQFSTGPGKARSSQNAFRHGLASSQLMIPGETQSDYDALVLGFFTCHKPLGVFECVIVDRMALSHWLTLRAIRLQAEAAGNPEASPLQTSVLVR